MKNNKNFKFSLSKKPIIPPKVECPKCPDMVWVDRTDTANWLDGISPIGNIATPLTWYTASKMLQFYSYFSDCTLTYSFICKSVLTGIRVNDCTDISGYDYARPLNTIIDLSQQYWGDDVWTLELTIPLCANIPTILSFEPDI